MYELHSGIWIRGGCDTIIVQELPHVGMHLGLPPIEELVICELADASLEVGVPNGLCLSLLRSTSN